MTADGGDVTEQRVAEGAETAGTDVSRTEAYLYQLARTLVLIAAAACAAAAAGAFAFGVVVGQVEGLVAFVVCVLGAAALALVVTVYVIPHPETGGSGVTRWLMSRPDGPLDE